MLIIFSWFLISSFLISILLKNDFLIKANSLILLIYYYFLPLFNLSKTNSYLIKASFDKSLTKKTIGIYLFSSYIFSMLIYSVTQSIILNVKNKHHEIMFQYDIGSSALIVGEFLEEFSRFTFLTVQKGSNLIGYITISTLFTIIHYSNLSYFKTNYLEYYIFIFIFSLISIQIGNKLGWKYSVILHIIVNFLKFYFII